MCCRPPLPHNGPVVRMRRINLSLIEMAAARNRRAPLRTGNRNPIATARAQRVETAHSPGRRRSGKPL